VRLDNGIKGYYKYDKDSSCGMAVARCYVNATPAQAAGFFADRRNSTWLSVEIVEESYTAALEIAQIPVPIPTVSDREVLTRSVWFKNDQDNSYVSVNYTVEDERRPVEGGKVRVAGEPSEKYCVADTYCAGADRVTVLHRLQGSSGHRRRELRVLANDAVELQVQKRAWLRQLPNCREDVRLRCLTA
jgi:hypothetical protein